MDNIIIYLFFVLGIILMIKGGDWFVESAVWLARVTGIPNILIGATIVSVATTLPELLVSTFAIYQYHYDVAIGNVVGSLICNIGLILGINTLISPVKIDTVKFSIKGFFMIFATFGLIILLKDKIITPQEGNILLILFIIYIFINIWEFYNEEQSGNIQILFTDINKKSIIINTTKFIFGTIFIMYGAKLVVDNGVLIAKTIGVPEQVISVTIIALGTSLPELTTAINASIKGENQLSIGNILGANILDILLVLGASSKISDRRLVISYQNFTINNTIYNIPQSLYLDIPIALLLMIILVVGGSIKGEINRLIALTILIIYIIYLSILVKFFI